MTRESSPNRWGRLPLVVFIIIPHRGEELLEVHSVIGPRVQPCPLEMHVPVVGLIEELPLLDVIIHADDDIRDHDMTS